MCSSDLIGKARHRTLFTAKETADIITKPSVPFLPSIPNEATYLVQSGGIPRPAINLVPANAGSDSISHNVGGFGINWPHVSRARIEARSNRNPSTCISATQ